MDEEVPAQVMDDEINLRQYLQVLWRRRWLIAGLTALTVVVAWLVTRAATPIYEATTTLLLRQPHSSLSLLPGASEWLAGGRPSVQNSLEILRSRTVMERALQRLGWAEAADSGAADRLQRAVTVQPVQGADHIRIRVRLPDPERARLLADALVSSFTEFNQEMNRLETHSALEFVQEQLGQVRANLDQAEQALLRYKQGERLVAPSAEAQAAIGRLTELEKMRAATVVSSAETATRLQQVESELRAQAPTLTTATTISNNPIIERYKLRLAELEVELSGALQNLAPGHPRLAQLRAEIDEVRRRMGEEVTRIVSAETRSLNPVYQELTQQFIGLQVERVALKARADALDRLITREEALLQRLPQRELELARLAREQRVNEELYVFLRTRFEELRIQEAMVSGDVRVVDSARVAATPVSPRPLLNMAVALFVGLFAGVGVAFVLEFMDTTIKADEDLERLLGVPVLARIPRFGAAQSNPAQGGR